ncbi:MAG: hypothetical protein WD851_05740 [Pirellulales bacterium]
MGYDCTLHVVDEDVIRTKFVPRLLDESNEFAPFDTRDDANELWATVRESLAQIESGSEAPHRAAVTISQLAVAFSAAELPYHYERGFCLSMWDSHQEEAVTALFPKKHRGNPETLFAALISRHPALKGEFPTDIESNFCTGVYIPANKVPQALKWVTRKVNSFAKPDRRLFRGLLLVLKEAARQGKAYWEGTDLPVPMATMHPPESERIPGLEDWKNPDDVYMDFLVQDGPTLVFAHGIGFPRDCRTVHIDLSHWPPKTTVVWNEYAVSAARSLSGRWVTASMTKDQEYMYRARVRTSVEEEPTLLLPPEERENGLSWASFIGDRVIAVLRAMMEYPNASRGDYSVERLIPSYPLLEEDGRLVPIAELSPSPERFPNIGSITLRDGSNVFIWDYVGYEFRNGEFTPSFSVPGRWSVFDNCALVTRGLDGFYFFHEEEGLFSVRRGEAAVRHLPKLNNVRGISPGPGNSVLVREFGERSDLGKLYFPDEQTYVRIEPDVFPDEDPFDIRSLHYIKECDRLIAATPYRLWSRPIEYVLSLPRYNAATGRIRRSKPS